MRSKISKILTLLLAAAIFTTACGDNSKQPDSTSDATYDTESDTNVQTEIDSLEKLGVHDFGGAEYVILASGTGYGNQPANDFEISVDTLNGEVVNDAVYERERKIEERYNVKIEKELMALKEPTATIIRNVTAGDMEYSLVSDQVSTISTAVTAGCLANYYDFSEIDLTAPWWNQNATESLTINGKCYLQMNYINVASPLATHCMFYNKRVAEDYDVSGIYKLVLDGKWTMDKFFELSSNVLADLNGDSLYDDNDMYGFMGSLGAIGIVQYAFDNDFIEISNDGAVSHKLMNERMQKTVEMAYKLCFESDFAYARPIAEEAKLATLYCNGQSLFYAGFFFDMLSTLRDMEDDFGLLPYPKLDEAQDKYYTTIHGAAPLIGIPGLVENKEMVGVVTEALAIESYNNVRPALVDLTIRNKLLRDDESSQIYDLFLDGIRVETAFVYKSTKDLVECIYRMMNSNTSNLASYIDSKMPAAVASYQTIIDHFYE
ncbi:MAG: hypothetical protein HFE63_06385 [Clostridiales bacterium]|nr:hypothetical protein [Clostridiales bacterium]